MADSWLIDPTRYYYTQQWAPITTILACWRTRTPILATLCNFETRKYLEAAGSTPVGGKDNLRIHLVRYLRNEITIIHLKACKLEVKSMCHELPPWRSGLARQNPVFIFHCQDFLLHIPSLRAFLECWPRVFVYWPRGHFEKNVSFWEGDPSAPQISHTFLPKNVKTKPAFNALITHPSSQHNLNSVFFVFVNHDS